MNTEARIDRMIVETAIIQENLADLAFCNSLQRWAAAHEKQALQTLKNKLDQEVTMPYQIEERLNARKANIKKLKIRRLKPIIENRKMANKAAKQLNLLFPDDAHEVVEA